MKNILFLIFFFCILNGYTINQVVNACGSDDIKKSTSEPNTEEDCKDNEEAACKLVEITKNSITKKYCAIIHGKYNDQDVISDVKSLIGADELKVSGKSFIIKTKPLLCFIFIILIFL